MRADPAMRVLDVTNFYAEFGGGVRSYLRQKVRWLNRLGIERHVLIVPSSCDQSHFRPRTHVHEIRGPYMPGRPGYRVLTRPARLWELIRAEDPDIIEVGSPYVLPLMIQPMGRALDIRVVGYFHTDYTEAYFRPWGESLPPGLGWLLTRASETHMRAIYSRFDATCVATQLKLARLKSLGVPHLYHTPLGVDTDLFCPERRDPHLHDTLGVPQDKPWCLCVGRLSFEKGITELLHAMNPVHQTCDLHLVLVGDGPLQDEVRATYGDRPWFHWRSRVNDPEQLATLYASADFFVAPGGKETFALATVEALASGQAVVGARTGGVGELLDGQRAGMLCDTSRPDQLARTLIAMVKARRKPMSADARELALSYRWDRVLARLLDAYADVLRQKPRGPGRRRPHPSPFGSTELEDPNTPVARDLRWALGESEPGGRT